MTSYSTCHSTPLTKTRTPALRAQLLSVYGAEQLIDEAAENQVAHTYFHLYQLRTHFSRERLWGKLAQFHANCNTMTDLADLYREHAISFETYQVLMNRYWGN